MTSAIELYRKDGAEYIPTGVWYCSKCRLVYQTKESADNCCGVRKCEKCGSSTRASYYVHCDDCIKKDQEEKNRKRWESMPTLDDISDEPLYDGDDRYYRNFDEYLDDYFDGDEKIIVDELDEYLEICEFRPLIKIINPEAVLDTMRDWVYDEIDIDDFTFYKENEIREMLQKYLEEDTTESYQPIKKKIIVMDMVEKYYKQYLPVEK